MLTHLRGAADAQCSLVVVQGAAGAQLPFRAGGVRGAAAARLRGAASTQRALIVVVTCTRVRAGRRG
eukprot:508194-Alexandrium_andersonii.AAC.1